MHHTYNRFHYTVTPALKNLTLFFLVLVDVNQQIQLYTRRESQKFLYLNVARICQLLHKMSKAQYLGHQ